MTRQRMVWVAILLIAAVALFQFAALRRITVLTERFNNDVSIARLTALTNQIPKSNAYIQAGLSRAFSDGITVPKGALFFNPAYNDIVCQLGTPDAQRVCSPAKTSINYVSKTDDAILLQPTQDCSKSVMNLAIQPLDPDDSQLRIFDGIYSFVKACITVPVTMVNDNSLLLDMSTYGAKVLVLARPSFLSGSTTKLYAVGGALASPTADMVAVFDSADTSQRYGLFINQVTDPAVAGNAAAAGGTAPSLLQNLQAQAANLGAGSGGASVMLLSMYYIKYMRPAVQAVSDVKRNVGTSPILTLFGTTDRFGAARRATLFSSSALTLSFGRDPATNQPALVAQTRSASGSASTNLLPLPTTRQSFSASSGAGGGDPDAFFVVSYTSSLLIMAAFGRDPSRRITYREVGGVAPGQFSSRDVAEARAKFAPPKAIHPYDNTAIPNLAEIAINMGFI